MAKKKSTPLEMLAHALATMELSGPPKAPEKFIDKWVVNNSESSNDQPAITH